MKPPPVFYERPASVQEALDLLAEHGEEAKVLAGGQSLIPLMNFRLARPARLIDIGRLEELAGIAVTSHEVRIGATTRMSRLVDDRSVAEALPLLAEAAHHVAHMQIRNRGTVGGSVAHADPSAEVPAALLALDATVVARSHRGERSIAIDEFLQGVYMTTLGEDELLTEIVIPRPSGAGAFEEFSRRDGDFAIGAVACQIDDDRTRLAAIGLGGRAVRLTSAEPALGAGAEPDVVRRAVRAALAERRTGVEPYILRLVEELAVRAYTRAQRRLEDAHGV